MENVLRKEIVIKSNLSQKILEIEKNIKSSFMPVSLHVRKSDFTSYKNKSIFSDVSVNYYHNAIEFLIKKLKYL